MNGIAAGVSLCVLAALVCSAPAAAQGYVTRQGPRLLLDGQPYRAIGVNMPHLSQGYMGTWFHWREIYGSRDAMKAEIIKAVEDAERHKVAFIRFFASPGYPKDTAELYLADPDEYWRQMDELFALCAEHHLRLVPSLGVVFKWSHECREPRRAVLDPNSDTHVATYGYVREFVTRYRDDPTVLMWELENEAFLAADVDMAGRPSLPQGVFPEGFGEVPAEYTREDSLNFDDLITLYREMTVFILELDPNHLVTSGDAGPREESESRRETFPDFRFRVDTLREHLANLLESQAEPLDVASIHAYGTFESTHPVGGVSRLEFVRREVQALHVADTPVFVGELGQSNPQLPDDPEAKWTCEAIDMLDAEGVALVALWVWHFPWQAETHDIPSGDAHPLLMERVAAFNQRHAGLD